MLSVRNDEAEIAENNIGGGRDLASQGLGYAP